MSIRWSLGIILADAHVASQPLGSDRRSVLKSLCEAVRERRGLPARFASGKTEFIFVAGDIAAEGREADYHDSASFLDDLAEASGCRREWIFAVPGNHDVYHWGSGKQIALDDSFPWNVRQDPDRGIGATAWNEFLRSERRQAKFSQRFTNYNTFIRRQVYGVKGAHRPEGLDGDDYSYVYAARLRADSIPLVIVGLNSAWTCERTELDSNPRKAIVGNEQINEALSLQRKAMQDDLAVPACKIWLCHHPPECLREEEAYTIQRRLTEETHVLVCGHRHDPPEFMKVASSHLRIGAGAAGTNRMERRRDRFIWFVIGWDNSDPWQVSIELFPMANGVPEDTYVFNPDRALFHPERHARSEGDGAYRFSLDIRDHPSTHDRIIPQRSASNLNEIRERLLSVNTSLSPLRLAPRRVPLPKAAGRAQKRSHKPGDAMYADTIRYFGACTKAGTKPTVSGLVKSLLTTFSKGEIGDFLISLLNSGRYVIGPDGTIQSGGAQGS